LNKEIVKFYKSKALLENFHKKLSALIMLIFVISYFLLKASNVILQSQSLNLHREWTQLDYNFPTAQIRADAIQRKLFVPLNNVPIDVDVDYIGLLFKLKILRFF
jgi:hypothetical protein